jgi:site-specific DNA-cytosine methylase
VGSDLTHASFFSGVGGLDLGLERAGWRTVSFSEIDPYASAVLAQRWPGVPNLGSIVELRADDIDRATLWTGGFPCQDLSIAGKRRGMGEGTRSGLAYAFLDLAAVHRPRFVLLENVPGLLSSHGGRDMAALLGALVELGYGVGYRVLDARYFGVPQRRRRVFILGVSPGGHLGAERAAEVLSVGSRCDRHPPAGVEAGAGAARGVDDGPIGTLREHVRPGSNTDHTVLTRLADDARGQAGRRQGTAALRGHEPDPRDGADPDAVRESERPSPDADRVRTPHGLAGRPYDRDDVAPTLLAPGREGGRRDKVPHVVQSLDTKRGGPDDNEAQAGHLIPVFVKTHNVSATDGEHWTSDDREARSMNAFDGARTTLVASGQSDDPMLPLGLDSHRYRCCGNGVVSDVSEWIGRRLAAIVTSEAEVAA